MKINKIFLLITLILLFVGFSYASEVSNDTTASDISIDIEKDTRADTYVIDSPVKEEKRTDKQIQKQTNTNKTTKTASKSYNVTNYNTLHKVLTKDTYDTVTINIKSNIILTGDTILNEAIKKLTINGNGKKIDGKDQFRFLSISPSNTVKINNIKIINCYTDGDGGAIYNNGGTLIMNNSILTNNTAEYYGGAINNNGHLTLLNIKLYNNNAIFGGGIHNDYGGTTNIYNTILYSNSVARNGGAILNVGKITVTDSELKNNLAIYGGGIHNEYGGILEIYNSTLKNNIAQYLGGAICNYLNGFTYIYNSILNNNSAVDSQYYANDGGAIFSRSNLTVINSTISNNRAFHGGAIYNTCNLTINNTVLDNNFANYSGGAIHNTGKTIIYNTTLINNQVYSYGGAIYNEENLNIKYSVLNNNHGSSGGAICNFYYGNTSVYNSSINNNTAWEGGAVYNSYDGTTNIYYSILNYNNAVKGGAIFNGGILTIKNSKLNYNNASEGGAINNQKNLKIIYCNLNNNNADNGGAIYNECKLTITNSRFNNNNASYGGAIYNNDDIYDLRVYLNLTNSRFNNNIASYGGAIYNDMAFTTIINNTFTNNSSSKDATILSEGRVFFYNINENETFEVTYGTDTIINNTFIKNKANTTGKAIIDEGVNTTIKNNINDDISQDSSTIHLKNTNNSIVTNNTFIDGRKMTVLTVNKISNTKYGETITIEGMLKNSDNKALSSANVVITLNGKNIKVKTDSKGYYTYKTTASTIGTNNVTVTYKGNTKYYSSSNKTSFTVKQPTMIKHTYMGNVNIGTTVKILGRLVSNVTGQAIKYATVTVKINDDTYKIKSDGAGYVRMNYTVNSYDEQIITFSYAGSSLNLACRNSTSFKVKQPTWIKLASTGNVVYGSTVKLVARLLTKDNTAVKYVMVNVTVNGKLYQVKSDGAGYIRLNYTVNTYDDQKVTYKFGGSSLYMASSNSTSFKVKQPTWIKHASIGKVKLGSTVKIVGRVLYNGTNSVKYVPVNVTVNNKVYQLTTDGAGYYRLNYTATTAGVNTFTSNFGGNSLYLASTNSTKFTVVK